MKTKTKGKTKLVKARFMQDAAAVAAVKANDEKQNVASESLIVKRTSIMPSPTNPRKSFPAGPLQELADSIRAQGLIQPIVVRRRPKVELHEPTLIQPQWEVLVKHPDGTFSHNYHELELTARQEYENRTANGAEFELIAGERRWRATELAELDEVPILVRNMTDQQVIEAQHVENLQREDVSPAEEAESYRKLIDSKIHTVESLAERLGIKRSTLYLRLKLTKLSAAVRAEVDAGRLPYTVAELIGRIPGEKLQALALEKLMRGEYHDGKMLCVSFRRAKEILEEKFVTDLKGAPFDTKATYEGKIKDRELVPELPATLAAAGPCDTCPRRSGNCKDEFPDITSPNVCTDPDCFAAKRSAHQASLRREHEAAGAKVLTGKDAQKCFSYYGDTPANGYVKLDAEYPGTNKSIKKLLKGAEPTPTIAIIDGKAKKVYHLDDVHKALVDAGVEVKAPKKETQDSTGDYAKRQAATREKAKERTPIAQEAFRLLLAKVASSLDEADLIRLLLFEDVNVDLWAVQARRGLNRTKLEKAAAKMDAKELRMLVYESLFPTDLVNDYDANFDELLVKECKRCGIDMEKVGNELKLDDAKPDEAAAADLPKKAKKKGAKK